MYTTFLVAVCVIFLLRAITRIDNAGKVKDNDYKVACIVFVALCDFAIIGMFIKIAFILNGVSS